MKHNIGKFDRGLRVVLGILLLALTITGTIGVWGWIGLIPLLTSFIGFCPAYTLFGLNSCNIKQ